MDRSSHRLTASTARLRETSVGPGRSNESLEDGIERAESLEEDKREDREETKNLKEKREADSGGKERSFSAAEITTARYCSGVGVRRRGLRSMRRTIRCVLAYNKSPAIGKMRERERGIDFGFEGFFLRRDRLFWRENIVCHVIGLNPTELKWFICICVIII